MTATARRTDERVLATLTILRDEIDGANERISNHALIGLFDRLDADELFERVEALEARLPTEPDDGAPEPEFVAEVIDGLDVAETTRAIVAGAIELQLPVTFVYTNGDGLTLERTVSPYELRTAESNGKRFLLGYDHDRDGIRQFDTATFESLVCTTADVDYRQPVG